MTVYQKIVIYAMKMITKNMIIGECISKYPETAEYLMKMGFHCIGCFAAGFETLEQGLKSHGKSNEEIEKIIKDLNKLIE